MKLDLFPIIIIAVVVLAGGYAAFLQIRTRRRGVETTAVVTGVTERWERTGDADSLCYGYTVEYTNCEGAVVTAALGGMSNADRHLSRGDRILIRYLKDRQDYPIMVKKL